MRPRDEDEQPGPVPGGYPGEGQGLVQRAEGLWELAGQRAALRQGPVQVHEQVRVDSRGEPATGHLFRLGRVTDPVQGLGEPAHQAVVLG